MITPLKIQKMKKEGIKIAALTSYDFSTAKYADEAGIDLILVGDSVGQVVLGYDSTTKVTLDDMKVFTRAVVNGAKNPLIVVDMPFMSYHTGVFEAVKNAGELIRLGAGAVKIEGGFDYIIDTIKQMTKSGIPVMGHLGFTPQYINVLGGHFVQGKNLKNTIEILEAAKKIQDAGAFSLVLEMVPDVCAKYISENLEIPVIGIGAGKYTDGQILVVDDVLGKFDGFSPKFVRKYADIKTTIKNAVSSYVKDVKEQTFPEINESFQLKEDEYEEFESYINKERAKILS
ncbi:TPA: 3-methyl-2-oxobutanoate hydroxymethyltransferase [Candidatus Galligastranaerophilus intestinigallinarum]|nr:3-methyl-2-oxobutanoate hydroxymethyltransferase [Candidatus Galligastranaerophilus intestinigallinarum]